MAGEMHPYSEAGRRLKAALVSYQLGRSGVDYTLRQIPSDPGEEWSKLAEQLLYGLAMQMGNRGIPK